MKNLSLFVLAASLAGCTKPVPVTQAPAVIDHELRTFLGIRTIDATVTVPDSAQAYYPVAIMFTDGREIAHAKGVMHSAGGSRTARPLVTSIQLMWQIEDRQFRRAALVQGGNIRELSLVYPDWQRLAGVGQSWRRVSENENLTYKGVSVRGILAVSGDEKTQPQLYPTSDTLAAAAKYVVVLGVVFGSDTKSLEPRFLSQEL